jgi:peptidoglycan/xylan/chitin deacetylase (PgdA/CDA1 family)
VERGSSGRQEVAFTFDAGEGAGHTEQILDLLDRYGIKGTFGVTGQWVEQNPELIQRIVREGHQLINHTYDHRSFTGESLDSLPLTDGERRESIELTEAIIRDATDGYVSSPYFRFPYGDYDTSSLDLLEEMGYSYTIWWSCDTWAWLDYTPDQIVERCGESSDKGGPGAILLLHLAQDGDWEALEPLITSYLDAGYDFVTVEEMIQP